jgi:hypothetical protein
VRALRFALWRQPIIVLDNARRAGVSLRPLPTTSARAGRRGLEAKAPGMPAVQLLFGGAASAPRLVELRYRDRAQRLRVTELSAHRRVEGLLVAHSVRTRVGRRKQALRIDKLRFGFSPR